MIAPTAAIRAEGRVRSYAIQPIPSTTPTIRNEASCQLIAPPPGRPSRPVAGRAARERARPWGPPRRHRAAAAGAPQGAPAQELGALLGQERTASPAEDAGGLGREVPASGEQLG